MEPMNPIRPSEDFSNEAPPKLAAAFGQLRRREVFVPPSIDEAVLNAARRHLAKAKQTRFSRLRQWIIWPSLATGCAALIAMLWTTIYEPAFAREDLNRDGRVDILDAFQLARELEADAVGAAVADPDPGAVSNVSTTRALDLNGDGLVDREDVKFIAAQAVKLGKGGRS